MVYCVSKVENLPKIKQLLNNFPDKFSGWTLQIVSYKNDYNISPCLTAPAACSHSSITRVVCLTFPSECFLPVQLLHAVRYILTGVIISYWLMINKHLFQVLFTFPPLLHPVIPEISLRKFSAAKYPPHIIRRKLSVADYLLCVSPIYGYQMLFSTFFWEVVLPLICTNLLIKPVRMWKAGTEGVLTSDIDVLPKCSRS